MPELVLLLLCRKALKKLEWPTRPRVISKVMGSCHADDKMKLGFLPSMMLMIIALIAMLPCHFDSTLCGFGYTNGTYRW